MTDTYKLAVAWGWVSKAEAVEKEKSERAAASRNARMVRTAVQRIVAQWGWLKEGR